MIGAHQSLCNIRTFEDVAADVTVGVVDSVYDPGGDFDDFNRHNRSERFLETDRDSTTDHGKDVTKIISNITNNLLFEFYQIVDINGNFADRDLLAAVVWAADYGVDVLNLSVGTDHFSNDEKDCDLTGPTCAVTEAAEYAENNGVVLVAATGNNPGADAVCCPALSDSTIAVGGCVAKCTAAAPNDQRMIGPSLPTHPQHAYWVERPDQEGLSGDFCSMFDCGPSNSCEQNRSVEPWEGNVRFVSDTPDTVAPVTFPRMYDENLMMGGGTSFAAPLVTGGVANVIGALMDEGIDPNPATVRRLIRISGQSLDDIPVGVFDERKFANELFDHHGIGQITPPPSDPTFRPMW